MRDKTLRRPAAVKDAVYNVVMSDADPNRIKLAVDRLARAGNVTCLTGAGVSAESGVPTFRGDGGFWAGRRVEDLATPEAFTRNPEDVWRFYLWRRRLLAGIQPNSGHEALATIEKQVPRFTLITQNVDGLHRSAGSRNVIELHGNIWIDRCPACPRDARATPDAEADRIPECGVCGGMMRPGVVWFGEPLPAAAIASAREAASGGGVMLVVGTSAVVQPAASLADWARTNGAWVIEINPDATVLSPRVDLRFPHPAGRVLPRIAESLARAPRTS